MVVVCTLAGARIMTLGSPETRVWQVQRDLAAGAMVSVQDLVVVSIPADLAGAYLPADELPEGPLTRDIRAGEVVSRAAVSDATARDVRWVSVPVEPLHAPTDLAVGDRVDVWSTPDLGSGLGSDMAGPPRRVLAQVLVAGIDADARGFAGDYGVVLEVQPDDTERLLAAVRGGVIDLARVPVGVTP